MSGFENECGEKKARGSGLFGQDWRGVENQEAGVLKIRWLRSEKIANSHHQQKPNGRAKNMNPSPF